MKGPKPVIGLVGGMGSGKSMVAEMLARRGARIISGDQIGHEALKNSDIKKQIVDRFGEKILDESGDIDRRRLGRMVFADASERQALEKIVFPRIGERVRQELESAWHDQAVSFVVLDAAIMLEAGWDGACDFLVFIDADRKTRLERLARQRGWTAEEVEARERAQMELDEKRKHSDFRIDNAGSLEDVERQLSALLGQMSLGNRKRRTETPSDAS
jgi:dephospho-CoA kinase